MSQRICDEKHHAIGGQSKVLRTENNDGEILRERLCHNCGQRFWTRERTQNSDEQAARERMDRDINLNAELTWCHEHILEMLKHERLAESAKAEMIQKLIVEKK